MLGYNLLFTAALGLLLYPLVLKVFTFKIAKVFSKTIAVFIILLSLTSLGVFIYIVITQKKIENTSTCLPRMII